MCILTALILIVEQVTRLKKRKPTKKKTKHKT
uniref:Uncharacterized protein n=1 Tax=Anguilla anguilla TaxID=7936 RepID=A0A0E9WKX8_ANGAN